jgi:hypothetical protein
MLLANMSLLRSDRVLVAWSYKHMAALRPGHDNHSPLIRFLLEPLSGRM